MQVHCQKFIELVGLAGAEHKKPAELSNGPDACIAEIVENTLAKPRDRGTIHHDAQYYRIRNHLVDFLVNRSKLYQSGEARRLAQPPLVRPGLDRAPPAANVIGLRH